MKEGLDWTKIDFYDNQPICDLIDKVRNLNKFKKYLLNTFDVFYSHRMAFIY